LKDIAIPVLPALEAEPEENVRPVEANDSAVLESSQPEENDPAELEATEPGIEADAETRDSAVTISVDPEMTAVVPGQISKKDNFTPFPSDFALFKQNFPLHTAGAVLVSPRGAERAETKMADKINSDFIVVKSRELFLSDFKMPHFALFIILHLPVSFTCLPQTSV
jgi:hypothetical protein